MKQIEDINAVISDLDAPIESLKSEAVKMQADAYRVLAQKVADDANIKIGDEFISCMGRDVTVLDFTMERCFNNYAKSKDKKSNYEAAAIVGYPTKDKNCPYTISLQSLLSDSWGRVNHIDHTYNLIATTQNMLFYNSIM